MVIMIAATEQKPCQIAEYNAMMHSAILCLHKQDKPTTTPLFVSKNSYIILSIYYYYNIRYIYISLICSASWFRIIYATFKFRYFARKSVGSSHNLYGWLHLKPWKIYSGSPILQFYAPYAVRFPRL